MIASGVTDMDAHADPNPHGRAHACFARHGGVAAMLDDGPAVLTTSVTTISPVLMTRARDLVLTYRGHTFRVLRGGSDGADDNTIRLPRRGSAGGIARAARLTPEQRQEIARSAARARWERFRNGIGTGPPDARLGGLARARQLTPEQRSEISRKALEARLSRRLRTSTDTNGQGENGDQAEAV